MIVRKKILLGIIGLGIIGTLAWVSIVEYPECGNKRGIMSIEIEDLLREKIGSVSVSDISTLDTAPVQGLKVYMKGGDIE